MKSNCGTCLRFIIGLLLFVKPVTAFVTQIRRLTNHPLSPEKQSWQTLSSFSQPVQQVLDKSHFLDNGVFVPLNSGVALIGNYLLADQKMEPGTKAHLHNAFLGMTIPLLFSQIVTKSATGSALSHTIMKGSFFGLVVDNLINAYGKHIGEGHLLRRLAQLRLVLHGITIPSLFVPVIEVAMNHKLFTLQASKMAIGAAMAYAFCECIEWLFFYDINNLLLVDNRYSGTHTSRAVAGTLTYTSGKVLKCVAPAALLQIFTLTVGCLLWSKGAVAGLWLMASGALTILSCSVQRPHIQAYGETKMLTLMWAALLSMC